MARFIGGTFRSVEAIGQALIDSNPAWEDRDPEELGERALEHPTLAPLITLSPQDYSEIDVSTALGKLPEDFSQTAGESIEGLGEMISHPIDTGIAMGKMGLAGIQEGIEASPGITKMGGAGGQLLGLLGKIPLSEETREGAREMGRGVVESVSPEGLQHRPALAISNALMAVPGGAGVKGATTAGKYAKALAALKKVRNVADPAELPITAARAVGRGVSRGAKVTAGTAAGIGKKAFQSAKGFADAVRSGNSTLRTDLFSALLGFTTGRGPRFIREMIRKGSPSDAIERTVSVTDETGLADPGQMIRQTGPEVQREFRQMGEGDAERIIATRALESVDRFKEGMTTTFQEGLSKLPLDSPVEIDLRLRRKAGKALRDMNVKVEGAERLDVEDVPLDVVESQRGATPSGVFPGGQKETRTRVPTGEAEFSFPDFGDTPGQTTTISAQGGGRAMLEEAFGRLINAPERVSMEDLMNFRRGIDDALSVTTSEVSGEARVALGRLRQIVADRLSEIDGYTEVMGDYEEASTALFRMEQELGVVPGALTTAGEIRGVKTSTLVRSLMRTLSESGPETPFAALEELQQKGGDESLTAALVGAGSRPIAGTGLVVKSELSQAARLAAGTVALGGSLATFWKIPAAVMFSPRGVNEILLRALDPENLGGNIARGANRVTQGGSKARKIAEGISSAFKRANESTGGELAKIAAKEGWTLGQLFERLQINLGVDVEEGEFQPAPKATTTMETLGGIDLNPPAR